MKKLPVPFVAGSTLLALLISTWITVDARARETNEPIRLGAIFSMSSRSGFSGPLVGAPMKQAVTAVVEEVNRKGGIQGRPIELFVEDDQSSAETAAVAVTKLIQDKKVLGVVGPSLSDSAMSIIPICEREQVPLVVTGPEKSPFNKWIFLVGSGDVRGAENIADFAVKTLGARKIAVFHDTTNYGMTGMKDLKDALSHLRGVSVVIEEQFAPSDTNMIPQLSKIKAADPDLLVLYTVGAPAAVIAKNYRQLGMTVPVLGSHGVPTPEFLSLAGNTAEEHRWVMIGSKIAIADKLRPEDPYRKNAYDPFMELVREERGRRAKPNVYQAAAYDGIMVMVEALKAGGAESRAALRDALEKVRWYGLLGPFAVTPTDHQGSPKDESPAMIVRDGQYVPYQKEESRRK